MGKRSTLVAAAAGSALAAGAFARVARRARAAGKGFVEDVMPSILEAAPEPERPGFDEAHAPSHRHVPLVRQERPDGPTPKRAASRPFAKHRHGLRHPGRG